MDKFDFVIIGGGPTGYSAAMYAGRLNLKTVVFSKTPGGLIVTTDKVENWPGIKSISGFDIFQNIQEHAKEYNIVEKSQEVVEVRKQDNSFIVKGSQEEILTKTVLFATGAEYKKHPAPGGIDFENKGIHYCALCDGFAYKGKIVAVVGGGDSAAKEALELSQQASQVYIIYRGEQFKPEPINDKRIKETKNITFIPKTNIIVFKGSEKLEALELDPAYNNSTTLKLDGAFISIGHIPKSETAAGLGVELNQKKQIKIDRYTQTNVPGIFAAGDVTDTEFKQLITGSAEGVVAAYKAFNYISESSMKF